MFRLGCRFVIATGTSLAATLQSSRPKSRDSYPELLRSLVTLWRREPALQRAALIQGCLFGSLSALWTILALQLDANYHLNAQIAGLSGVLLFAQIAGKIPDRRGPYTVIGLGSAIAMLAVVDDQEKLSTR